MSERQCALVVKLEPGADYVSAGIYRVCEDDPDPVKGFIAQFLAGVQLQPEQCYEIAQRFTLSAIKLEERRKGKE